MLNLVFKLALYLGGGRSDVCSLNRTGCHYWCCFQILAAFAEYSSDL